MTWTRPAYEAIADFVAARTGLLFPAPRQAQAELGIRQAMAHHRSRTLEEYLQLLQTNPSVLDDLLEELTVAETYFFREPDQFEFLRGEVLPELRRLRPPSHVFRVWSAGCATGEEAYSLAMLFEEEGLGDRLRLHATDISRKALQRARLAMYTDWSLRGKGASLACRYLAKRGRHFIVKDNIRRLVNLSYLNLAEDSYPALTNETWDMDLILCRNVLIYLEPQTIHNVAARMYQSLAPGGWLLTSSCDPPLQNEAPWDTLVRDIGVFYRRPHQEIHNERRETREDASTVPLCPSRPLYFPPDPSCQADPEEQSAAASVRKLASEDVVKAEQACAAAIEAQAVNTELRYLHVLLLLNQGRDDEALQALRRVLYLDHSLAVAHFLLGLLLERHGDSLGALTAYRNVLALCSTQPPEEVVPFSDGESAGSLMHAAQQQIAVLEANAEARA